MKRRRDEGSKQGKAAVSPSSSKLSWLDRSCLRDGGRPLLATEEDDLEPDRLRRSASSSSRLKADLSSLCILLLLLAGAVA
jgi:hypothetical protein